MSTWTEVVYYIKTQLKPGVLGHTDVQKILNAILAIIQQVNAGDYSPTNTALWKAEVSYSADVVPVLWQDKWLVSNTAGNLGNVPISTSGVLHPSWRIIGSSPGSGIRIWEPIVYPNILEMVFSDGALYYLNREVVGAAPFVSVDFAGEVAGDVWLDLMKDHNHDDLYVTLNTEQIISGPKKFTNYLLVQEANTPILRLKTANNTQAVLNFRNSNNEDQAALQFDAGAGKLSILTRTLNTDIEILPHGTGSILLPNVPSGIGASLMLNESNEIVKGTVSVLNPKRYIFDFGSINNNPDVTGGGTYELVFTDFTFQTLAILQIGQRVEMQYVFYVDTENVNDRFPSIGLSAGTGITISSAASNWIIGNNLLGYFVVKFYLTRLTSTTACFHYDIQVNVYDGSVTETRKITGGANNATTFPSSGAINPKLAVGFKSAHADNKLTFIAGEIRIYSPNQ